MPRKEKKFHFIYKTTNNLSGKYYIGMHSTDKLEDGYLGSGKRLRYSINKYGEENHSREILEFLDSRKELKEREEEIVNLDEIAKNECMNLKVGGHGGFMKKDALKGGIALANKLKNDLEFKKEHSMRASSTMSNMLTERWSDSKYRSKMLNQLNWSGRKHKKSSIEKMRDAAKLRTGSATSQYGTCWIYNKILKESKKIKKENLDSYLSDGWIKGRKMK